MKVIFLDIDGVLCSERSAKAYGGSPEAGDPSTWDRFDRCAVDLLRRVVSETGAHVVLSSSWRGAVSIPTLEYAMGVKINDRTRDVASSSESRGQQIHEWLTAHPEVTRYAILDDEDDVLPAQVDKLCRTSKRNGFLLGHYDDLIEMLN